jgi:hypothetical protein
MQEHRWAFIKLTPEPSVAVTPLQTFFRNVESESFWGRLAPWLHVASSDTSTPPPSLSSSLSTTSNVSVPVPPSGYLRLDSLFAPATTTALARAITALRANDLHPTFVYVYDESWLLLDALRAPLSRLLGGDFEILADVWAWHIDPRIDRGGWPIHRGWYDDVREPAGSAGLVNIWIALTDANERNACMHLVPLPRDPHYPNDLRNLAALEPLALPLPVGAGSALVWDANAAHWGGACDSSFDSPRISASFTARRRGAAGPDTPSVSPPLTFRARLDLIADQFATYGHVELNPDRNEMRWAAMVRGMKQLGTRTRTAAPTPDRPSG